MGLIETEETNKYTFEPFASHQFYAEVNRSLVQQALAHLETKGSHTPLTIVDMACGTGAVTRLIAEEISKRGLLTQTRIIGVDPSAEALRRAQKGMDELGLNVEVSFVQGEADALPNLVHVVDAAFFCNAIHLVPDKSIAFQQVASILSKGGIFACNSAFYEGTYVPGTERFYRLWTRRAVGWLKKEHPEAHLSREAKAMAMQWLTPDEYIHKLNESGFGLVETEYTDAPISLDAWRDIGQYWLFIEGALPGVPLAYGAAALEAAVYQTGQELGLTEVPRTWLQLVATKS
ncbi:class I SAM-dependent methyltransferase [Ktedonosporobacter rubrisoli]|uniref:Class I SAM-dependent methyltransferase n=1 Tax=Ktedonosporobacter rubrisoli TaxID=2509675 RepID=A0A4P6JR26_KTERU|nr:class I SAM-dependent methyltransferase [Ktedonosporobacter rubrisoli]QBD77899.1 class I SAM-dependent methyltransferase [Ktedonosporobacter rubrisoli]